MNVENEVKVIKDNYSDFVVFVKIGAFYHVYFKDAYIVSYLFGYQLKKTQSLNDCGFPATTLDNVLKKMENQNISYVIVNNQFEIEKEKNFEKINKYYDVFDSAYKYLIKKSKIEEINRYLLENIYSENILTEINEIEKIIYKIK